MSLFDIIINFDKRTISKYDNECLSALLLSENFSEINFLKIKTSKYYMFYQEIFEIILFRFFFYKFQLIIYLYET